MQNRHIMRESTFWICMVIFFAIGSAMGGLGYFNKGPFGEHYVFQRVGANSFGVICLAIVCALLVYRTRDATPR
jgi:uncharacterized membrane protein YhaH (DUF805 family)